MKKFKVFYVIMIILCLIMIITKGFHGSIMIYSYNNYDKNAEVIVLDGFQGKGFLSIINCTIIAVIILLTIIITFYKNNKIKGKCLLAIVIIFLSLCIPIGKEFYSGGYSGNKGEEEIYLWNVEEYLDK